MRKALGSKGDGEDGDMYVNIYVLGSKGDGEDGDMYVNIYLYVHMNE